MFFGHFIKYMYCLKGSIGIEGQNDLISIPISYRSIICRLDILMILQTG